ncbi:DUF6653 family protein [Mycobacterium sherrisii]|uniref:DUF6653 family protein n=1 Tax=Mycobacterium sherrisii TaxID=243061 RepID=UPI0009FC2B8E|nr:DUF6653 family protein [Mycobacterium sherrisii]MEC4765423.1 DUF6653 family protein [Mycobacterium sherrisii]
MRRAVFSRHCHPCSAWTRWASTPLIVVAAWTGRRRHALWLAVWFAVNPFVFGEPAQQRAWSTRAMLGEELWITRRPRDAAMVVSGLTSASAVVAVLAARRHRLLPAAIATALQMALTLIYWRQMVEYLERERPQRGPLQ